MKTYFLTSEAPFLLLYHAFLLTPGVCEYYFFQSLQTESEKTGTIIHYSEKSEAIAVFGS